MALRLIELTLKRNNSINIEDILKNYPVKDCWNYSDGNREIIKILLDAENTNDVLAELNDSLSGKNKFRIILLSVDATLPDDKEKRRKNHRHKKFDLFVKSKHLSIEELFNNISNESQLNLTYIALVVLSTLVAAIGILTKNNIMVIGAMVIAPLLGPNMAMALGTTLGDFSYLKKSIITSIAYILSVLIVSVVIGFIFKPEPVSGNISEFSITNMGDVILSIAAGAAGALSITIGLSTMLVGVTVSLAVLPSLVTLGIMLGANQMGAAYGALLLFLTNIICINLAAVLTFLLQGIHPLKWWEEEKAKKATISAVILWLIFLAALIILIYEQHIS